jgi:V/A-type H+-transporting ATPase subunit B
MELATREFKNVNFVSGPLVILENGSRYSYGSMLQLMLPSGEVRSGQVLDTSEEQAVVQILEETRGLDVKDTVVSIQEEVATVGVSRDMIGRVFSGRGLPIDDLPAPVWERKADIEGMAINPTARKKPADFIQTGISAIDGFNTLVRGQKLPIFSGAGLPANEIAAQILNQARVLGEEEQFVIVFAAMGVTQREAAFFMENFREHGSLGKAVSFMNLASDPTIERILTPRCALTAAEYLAFEHGFQVLVILTDMTNYCEALREVATAREEIPGRRGYPGYMYTDLASLYERAGQIHGRKGSVTQIPILTMPDDDITHPIADLTGYITEGQIVLSRELHRNSIYPPINVLPSLSRLMNNGIGEGRTRGDHRELANQLYACYARGIRLRRLVAIVGEDALTEVDRKYLRFTEVFEEKYLNQGFTNRDVAETLDDGWRLLSIFPQSELRRITQKTLDKYYGELTRSSRYYEQEVGA